MVRGDGDKAQADVRFLLSCDARAHISSTAAVAAPKTCLRCLKVVQIEIYEYKIRELLDSGAVRNPVPERPYDKLKLEVDRNPAGLTRTDGRRA